MQILFIAYVISFGLLMCASYLNYGRRYYLATKTLTSMIFVLMACKTMKQLDMIWLSAFIFCFLGDIFLGLKERQASSFYFMLGLSSFLLGHLFFIIRMQQIVPFEVVNLMIPAILCLTAFFLTRMKKFHVQGLQMPILVYSLIVSLLCVKGIAMYQLNLQYFWLMIGCFSFFISDFILLFIYFYEDKVRIMKFFNLFTYYAAVFLMSITIFL